MWMEFACNNHLQAELLDPRRTIYFVSGHHRICCAKIAWFVSAGPEAPAVFNCVSSSAELSRKARLSIYKWLLFFRSWWPNPLPKRVCCLKTKRNKDFPNGTSHLLWRKALIWQWWLQVVEIGKGSKVKYELDKKSGLIKVPWLRLPISSYLLLDHCADILVLKLHLERMGYVIICMLSHVDFLPCFVILGGRLIAFCTHRLSTLTIMASFHVPFVKTTTPLMYLLSCRLQLFLLTFHFDWAVCSH